mmetsp:Transcript_28509/g.87246  ORF Transcript_28509/g.87246 Transcript_28509/m.87246 type:complete len:97 (-) Transcript_28509:369-659(-)
MLEVLHSLSTISRRCCQWVLSSVHILLSREWPPTEYGLNHESNAYEAVTMVELLRPTITPGMREYVCDGKPWRKKEAGRALPRDEMMEAMLAAKVV